MVLNIKSAAFSEFEKILVLAKVELAAMQKVLSSIGGHKSVNPLITKLTLSLTR